MGASDCPHPEKLRWPLVDEPGGPQCRCGCVWAPYLFITSHNLGAQWDGVRLEVYQCLARDGTRLDHWHTTDAAKKGPRPIDRVDGHVNGTVLSSPAIQKRWSRWKPRRTDSPGHRVRGNPLPVRKIKRRKP